MAKSSEPVAASDDQVRALLERYACPVPFHEVDCPAAIVPLPQDEKPARPLTANARPLPVCSAKTPMPGLALAAPCTPAAAALSLDPDTIACRLCALPRGRDGAITSQTGPETVIEPEYASLAR
jgi:hypothetical protein